MSQTQQSLTDQLVRFYRTYYRDEIGELAQHYPNEQRSLYVDYDDLYQFDPTIANDYEDQPQKVREYLEDALVAFELPADIDLSKAHVRVTNLPGKLSVDDFRTRLVGVESRIGEEFAVTGQVTRTTKVRPAPEIAIFECLRCGTTTQIAQGNDDSLQEPQECSGCERQGPFQLNESNSVWKRVQRARLQQPPEETNGADGQTVDVVLEDDLTGSFSAGDRVTIAGTGHVAATDQQNSAFEPYLESNAVTMEDTTYQDIDIEEHRDLIEAYARGDHGDPYELVQQSIAPRHQGDEKIKLAIAMQLFGGWEKTSPDGKTDRGDSHVLLLGDPGCGKSSLLRAVESISPRATYASGKGATAAGMTAAAVRDDFGDSGEWTLEAGALVLADGGIACVDEIDKVKDDALSSMHGALEAQKVEVSKAGINATLGAKTALLAAGNPKDGRFTDYDSIPEQIDLGAPMMSRFDLMFMVSDNPDRERDAEVVEQMIESRQAAGKHELGEDLTEDEARRVKPAIPHDVLRAYIACAKQEVFPLIKNEEVKQKLGEYYVNFRNANTDKDSPVPITFRKVEALQRLAEASARIRLSNEVEMQDVKRAISLVESSMKQVGYDKEAGQFDADIVETGSSKSQRDRRNFIKDVIHELQQEYDPGAPQEEVYDTCEAEGYDRDKIENEIEGEKHGLRSKGQIYEPQDGYYRLS